VPELPEVETMRRGIAPVVGARVRALRFPRSRRIKPLTITPGRRAFQRRVVGRRIEAIDRLGKRIILVLNGSDRVVFEPRMTGLALLTDPPTTEHLRARFELAGAEPSELLLWDRRGLGTLRLLDPDEFAEVTGRIGPDALDLPRGEVRARLGGRRRPIKVALLDQALLAGVGNIYASELLHMARVHPTRPCDALSAREWTAVERALQRVLADAIRYEGSTLNDGTYRTALNEEGGYQNHHRVYGREGRACPRCKGRHTVERIVLAQRATFFCARCQA